MTQIVGITGRSIEAAVQSSAIVAGGFMISPLTYGFAAILFAAQTTTDWRKVKKGLMTKKEFKKRMKINGAGFGGGILGASGGAFSGFVIGSLICPGIGSVIGAFGGAVAGGVIC